VDIGANKQVLQLEINTNQYGRVFQDRSHSFLLLPRSCKCFFSFSKLYWVLLLFLQRQRKKKLRPETRLNKAKILINFIVLTT
jgi:hypothetical protein